MAALLFLKKHNPRYKLITIDFSHSEQWVQNGEVHVSTVDILQKPFRKVVVKKAIAQLIKCLIL